MVCIPCFIVPVLLFIWHKFIQPYVLRYWNPWEKKDKDGNVIPSDHTKSPFDCTGGKCIFMPKKKTDENETTTTPTTATESIKADADKKDD